MDVAIGGGEFKIRFTICFEGSWRIAGDLFFLGRVKDFQGRAAGHGCVGGGEWGEAADEVVDFFCRLVPVDEAGFGKNFWGVFQLTALRLGDGF